jgi:hypothetical protein
MRPTILAAALLLILFAVGCGGDSGEGSSTSVPAASAPPAAAAARKAEAICLRMVAESQRMGARFRAESPDLTRDALKLTTENLIKPAIPVVESSSRQLRALRAEAESVHYDSYVSLFDPILAVLRERVKAGVERDGTRAHELELQLLDLTGLQRRLARLAGLDACDVDFIKTFASGGATR